MRATWARNLDERALQELQAYGRNPSRTGREIVDWLAARGRIVPLRTAQHWLASLRHGGARRRDARAAAERDFAAKTAAVENLMDYARLIGEARMLRDEDELTPELHEQIVIRFRGLLSTIGKSESWAAKSMAIAPSTLSQALSDTYAGDTESIIRRVDKWVEQQHGKLKTPKPEGFLKMSTAMAIIGAAKLAIDSNGLAVIYGPSGCGKTLAARYIASESPGAIYVAITEGTKRPAGLREEIYRALNLPKCKLTVPQMERAILEALAGRDRLIVVDEVHALVSGRSKEEDSLYMLRRIHDETKSPMVWFGTAELNSYLENGVGIRQGVDQIYSRVVQFLDLATPVLLNEPGPGYHTIDDIRKLVAQRGIRISSDGIEYLRDVSNTPGLGALRAVVQLLAYVMTRLKNKDRELSADLLRDAQHQRLGRAAAVRMEKRIDDHRRKVG